MLAVFGVVYVGVGVVLCLFTLFLVTRTAQLLVIGLRSLGNRIKYHTKYQQTKSAPEEKVINPANKLPERVNNLINLFDCSIEDFIRFCARQAKPNVSVDQVENEGDARALEDAHNPVPNSFSAGLLRLAQVLHAPHPTTAETDGQLNGNVTISDGRSNEGAMKVRRDAMGKLKTRGTITGTHAQAIGMIVAVAHLYHWRVVFFRPARTMKGWRTPVGGDGKGFVDLVLARDERVLFWEVKVGRDRLRPEQEAWLACLGGRVVNPFDDPDWQYILEALS